MIRHTIISPNYFIAVEIEACNGKWQHANFLHVLLFQKGKKNVHFNFAYILLSESVFKIL